MKLKYCITSQEHDSAVLKHPVRGAEVLEKALGIHWSVPNDTIISGSLRGKEVGPLLKDMTEEDIMNLVITRMTFLRLSAQTYNKLANLLGPLIFSLKVLSSRSCELASVDELEMDLSETDPDFVKYAKQFILNLKRIDEITPFKRAWIPEHYHLVGFLTSLDGGKAGYGNTIHALAGKCKEKDEKHDDDKSETKKKDRKLLRSLAITRSKISKRNIVSHECLSGKLGAEALNTLLQPLLFDYWDAPIALPFKFDSTCFLCMLNPGLELKSMLLSNANFQKLP